MKKKSHVNQEVLNSLNNKLIPHGCNSTLVQKLPITIQDVPDHVFKTNKKKNAIIPYKVILQRIYIMIYFNIDNVI